MLHVRVVVPPEIAARVLGYLEETRSVINVVHLPGVARKPEGDLLTCDVAREDGSVVLSTLRAMGCVSRGTVTADVVDVSISRAAEEAERYAAGSPADAVLWEAVSAQTAESSELSFSYLLFMVLSTVISAVAILTDSVVLLIGGMVVGPEFGPLAGASVALVQRRYRLAATSFRALFVGFLVGIVAAGAFTHALLVLRIAPAVITAHPQTLFISSPDVFSAIIALLAGVAGMASLTTARPSALIGVFISVTTIPAAANIGVAAAYHNTTEMRGAAIQLLLNLTTMTLAGVATLLVERLAFVRRLRAALRNRRRQDPPE